MRGIDARTPDYIDEGLVGTCRLMSRQRSSDLSSFVWIFEQAFVNLPNLSRPWDRPQKKAEKSLKYEKKIPIYFIKCRQLQIHKFRVRHLNLCPGSCVHAALFFPRWPNNFVANSEFFGLIQHGTHHFRDKTELGMLLYSRSLKSSLHNGWSEDHVQSHCRSNARGGWIYSKIFQISWSHGGPQWI
jgi:hypothetical protein